jgi:1-phosphofructokinase family hexose kinase
VAQVIVFVAGHASVDRLYEVELVQPGLIHRPTRVYVVPGGKGLNAARVARRLGAEAHVLTVLAGHAGRWIAEALEAEGVDGTYVWTDGETRTSVSIASSEEPVGGVTGFYEGSPPISDGAWAQLEAAASELIAGAEMVCLSGGLIAGAPVDGYRRIVEMARRHSIPVAIDSHGPQLLEALEAGPELVKLNAEEAAEALDVEVPESDALSWAAAAAAELRRRVRGNPIAVVTCGTSGMTLVDGSGEALGGRIDEISRYPVGSGDAVLASLALSFGRGAPAREMLALGLAAGAANAEVPGPGILDPDRVPVLAARASIAPIAL